MEAPLPHHRIESLADAASAASAGPLQEAMEEADVFFASFWKSFAVFGLVLLAFAPVVCVGPKLVAAVLRRARVKAWHVDQARYIIRIALIGVALFAAFGSVGVSFTVLFFGSSISLAYLGGVGTAISSIISAIVLKGESTLQPGRVVVIDGRRGVIVDANMWRVHMQELSSEPGFEGRNVYIPVTTFAANIYTSDSATEAEIHLVKRRLEQQQQQLHLPPVRADRAPEDPWSL